MRKRLVMLWTTGVLALAMVLPGTASAATYGKIKFVDGYCSGQTVHATFKLTKYSGFYATKLTMTVKGQGFYNGGWHNELNIGTYYVYTDGTKGGYFYKDSFFFKPGHSGSHRIQVIGKIWNGSHLVASGKATSGYCG